MIAGMVFIATGDTKGTEDIEATKATVGKFFLARVLPASE